MTQERDESGRFASSAVSKKKSNFKPSRINFTSSGSTGLNRVNGEVYEEFLQELAGRNGAKIFKEMRENDPIVGSIFFAIEMFMRRVKWFVDPAADTPEAIEDAKFVTECMEDMDNAWPDLIDEAMSMMEYGWSYHEILYKKRTNETKPGKEEPESKYNDGKYGWKDIEIRGQESFERWEFDEKTGELLGMWQRPAPDYTLKYIPYRKSLLFRTTVRKNNPEGRSVLRNAYRPWYFKKRIEEIEGVGVERDLAGLPFAEVPAEMMTDSASEDDKATLASIVELVKNVRRDEQEGVVWPQSYDQNGNPQYKFSLMSSGGTRNFSTNEIITRYETRIAMVVIADFILLGSEGAQGSFALATNKSGLFQSALSAWLDAIQGILNKHAIPRLFRLNGVTDREYPKFRHEEVTKPSLADLAVFVSALTGAGAQLFPDVELENHFRGMAQLPKREEDAKAKTDEDTLREEKLAADIAAAKELIKNPTGLKPELGKDPASVPGAPTKSTGKVKSKLPPASRRRTKAVNASENVSKKDLPPGKCKYCTSPATKGLLWAEGMAYIPACDKHESKARHRIEVTNHDEVVGIKPISKSMPEIDDASTMVALILDPEIAEGLKLDIEDPHVTLAFLGDTTPEEYASLVSALQDNLNTRNLSGQIGGIGAFPPADPRHSNKDVQDGVPWWTPVDVPGLSEMREQVVRIITRDTDVEVNSEHGFTPHMTIDYKEEGEAAPPTVPATPVRFDHLVVVRGGEKGTRTSVPFKPSRRVVVRKKK